MQRHAATPPRPLDDDWLFTDPMAIGTGPEGPETPADETPFLPARRPVRASWALAGALAAGLALGLGMALAAVPATTREALALLCPAGHPAHAGSAVPAPAASKVLIN